MQIETGMPVKSCDGKLVGTIAHVRNEHTLEITSEDGAHFIPMMWVKEVTEFAQLNKTIDEVRAGQVATK